jgi:hypothetical protein
MAILSKREVLVLDDRQNVRDSLASLPNSAQGAPVLVCLEECRLLQHT